MKEKEAEEVTLNSNLSQEERERLRQMSQISLWLDNYDDIFSDFDPRPYSQRALSDDFLSEAKKVSRETKHGKVQLKLLVPSDKRDAGHESVIKRRLRERFKEKFESFQKQKRDIIKQGVFFIIVGIIVMIVATFLIFEYEEKSMFVSFLIVLLEPAGWFLFWEGSNLIVFESKEQKSNLEFYKKMASCEVSFFSY